MFMFSFIYFITIREQLISTSLCYYRKEHNKLPLQVISGFKESKKKKKRWETKPKIIIKEKTYKQRVISTEDIIPTVKHYRFI